MRRAVFLLLCGGLVFVLAGCPAPGVSPYPMRVGGIGDTADYPLRAAGFEREKIVSYAPGNADVSVGYSMLTPEAQIASTIYLTAHTGQIGSAEEYFSLSRTAIGQHHPGAELLAENTVVLTKGGQQFTAQRAAYRYEDGFMGRRQPLYSVLMVWRIGDSFVKLRSTTPYAQRHLSESNNQNLLEAINWTAPPY